jgi:hypothetical protein
MGLLSYGYKLWKAGKKTSPTISSTKINVGNLKKNQETLNKLKKTTDAYVTKAGSVDPSLKEALRKAGSKSLQKTEKILRKNKKDGGRMGYKSGSKDYKDRDAGGGADSGKRGEAKSRIGVLINKANRRIRNSKLPESPMKEERIFNTKNERLSKIVGKENVGYGHGREVERPTKKAMGGRIGRKLGGGSNMGNTNVKKKYKGFSKLPETVQIKINKKLAKKV